MSGIGFTRGMTGRADLVRARQLGDAELEEYLAGLLGYRLVAPEPPQIEVEPRETRIDDTAPAEPTPTTAIVIGDIPFWQVTSFKVLPSVESGGIAGEAVAPQGEPSTVERKRKPVDLSFQPLSSSASLLTRLRSASPTKTIRGQIDVDRIVEELSRGHFLAAMPRSSRKVWGRSVQVFVDRSRRLIPYWEDQTRACLAIRDIYPPEGYSQVVLPEGRSEPSSMKIDQQVVEYQPPPPGSAAVALTDLGALARNGSRLISLWADRGRRLRDREVTPLAVVPYRHSACPQELSRYWTILPWETSAEAGAPALNEEKTEALVVQVLTLLSFTLRIEPQLIRFVRRLLAAGRGEPGIESRVWQHQAFADPHCEAAELPRELATSFRAALPSQDRELRRQIYEWVEGSHHKIYEGVWYAEMGNLGRDELIDEDQRIEMREWFESQALVLESRTPPDKANSLGAWHREVSERMLEAAYQDRHGLGEVLHQIWSIVHRDDPHAVLPDGADLTMLPPGTERRIDLRQLGDRLIASQAPSDGSPLALIQTRQSRIRIEPFDDFWEGGVAPAWADGWGRDDFGPWVDLRVEQVTQRLRWIPPGKFWMGSPEDEEGRYPDEGPRHEEIIASGFWMFDTPCTQALWEAVMGENPSRFKGPDRPVENVSWDQCQEFLKRLNARCTGLELRLPSEAQWEYACRAGTNTPRYRDDLNEIAWYRENSQDETYPVGQLVPNDWGLYDTLGNVLEWCENVWTDDYNPKKAAASAGRVLRGGSWDCFARNVRAACRLRDDPRSRDDDVIGFRCAEFSTQGPVGRKEKQGAERAGERGGVGAEHPGDRDTASGAGWINIDAPGMDAVSFATLTPVRVSSDVEQVVLRTTTLPGWASAMGRDKYGLWAEFTIEGNVAKQPTKRAARKKSAPPKVPLAPVHQRLRWIPPGRFLMGSPADEEGRLSNEGPQHEVTIAEGFWMFDTPCTQALWVALMGENPSEFKSPDRPVENVTWENCRKFVAKINEKFDLEKVDLALSLPSEAQWEYACRAGTTTATYAGPLKIEGENSAPILDAIAWYGGNSGIDFELSNGHDASNWEEKLFEFDKAGTHPVARKKANPWGLNDMLGNVWEWCEDVWVDDYLEEPRSAASDPASAPRVLRGGSFINLARHVRAAFRNLRLDPSYRDHALGFRCAEFRQGVPSGARQGGEAEGAEQPGDRDPTSAAARLAEDGGFSAQPN